MGKAEKLIAQANAQKRSDKALRGYGYKGNLSAFRQAPQTEGESVNQTAAARFRAMQPTGDKAATLLDTPTTDDSELQLKAKASDGATRATTLISKEHDSLLLDEQSTQMSEPAVAPAKAALPRSTATDTGSTERSRPATRSKPAKPAKQVEPTIRTASAERPAPVQRSVSADQSVRAAPPVVGRRAVPSARSMPSERAAPAARSHAIAPPIVTTTRTMPGQHPAPAARSIPSEPGTPATTRTGHAGHPAPAARSVTTRQSAPAARSMPGQHTSQPARTVPAARSMPGEHHRSPTAQSAFAEGLAPAARSTPAQHATPVERPAPSRHSESIIRSAPAATRLPVETPASDKLLIKEVPRVTSAKSAETIDLAAAQAELTAARQSTERSGPVLPEADKVLKKPATLSEPLEPTTTEKSKVDPEPVVVSPAAEALKRSAPAVIAGPPAPASPSVLTGPPEARSAVTAEAETTLSTDNIPTLAKVQPHRSARSAATADKASVVTGASENISPVAPESESSSLDDVPTLARKRTAPVKAPLQQQPPAHSVRPEPEKSVDSNTSTIQARHSDAATEAVPTTRPETTQRNLPLQNASPAASDLAAVGSGPIVQSIPSDIEQAATAEESAIEKLVGKAQSVPKRTLIAALVGSLAVGAIATTVWTLSQPEPDNPADSDPSLAMKGAVDRQLEPIAKARAAIASDPSATVAPVSPSVSSSDAPAFVPIGSVAQPSALGVSPSAPVVNNSAVIEGYKTQVASYQEEISWLYEQNMSLTEEVKTLNIETLELNEELLELELKLASIVNPPTETRIVYNFVNVPVGDGSDSVAVQTQNYPEPEPVIYQEDYEDIGSYPDDDRYYGDGEFGEEAEYRALYGEPVEDEVTFDPETGLYLRQEFIDGDGEQYFDNQQGSQMNYPPIAPDPY